ncbi:MAG: hypothetical protein LBD28_07185, partial [Tannerellaceae bacterium]|nr:hypothetical protein [Tannerellaceae bacterium]
YLRKTSRPRVVIASIFEKRAVPELFLLRASKNEPSQSCFCFDLPEWGESMDGLGMIEVCGS